MGERLKEAAGSFLGLVFLLAILAIPALFIVGAEWLSSRLLPLFASVSVLAFAVVLVVLMPLSAFERTRPFASYAILIASFIFGITLWMEGLLLSMSLWGTAAVVVGLFLAGVGVVPIAMLATLFNGMWSAFAELIVLTLLTFGTRFYAAWVGD